MKLPRLTTLGVLILVGIVVITLGQSGSSAFRRYLRCQCRLEEFVLTEDLCRRRAAVCEELSPRLREVAVLAREVAKTASSDYERTKWLEMAHSQEKRANELEHEALGMMARANQMAARAHALSRLAWQPWLAEP